MVEASYEDQQMPGKRINVSLNTHKQKRLVLSDWNELYDTANPNMSVPALVFQNFVKWIVVKWCALAGSSGTHSMCVCTYHENMRL